MASKKSWLDKIGGWILGDREIVKSDTGKVSEGESGQKLSNAFEKEENTEREGEKNQQKKDASKAVVTLEASWYRFLAGWTGKGFSSNCFVQPGDLEKTIKSLDEEFRTELIDALFRVSTDEEVLEGLAAILERGRVSGGDNIKAVRAYAYISALTVAEKRTVRKDGERRQGGNKNSPSENWIKNEQKTIEGIYTPTQEQLPILVKDEGEAKNLRITTANEEILNVNIKDLGLSIRATNCLLRAGHNTLSDMAGMNREEIIRIKNFGEHSCKELEKFLSRYNITLPIEAAGVSSGTTEERTDYPEIKKSTNDERTSRFDIATKDLGVSIKTMNCLYRAGINKVSDMSEMEYKDFISIKNFGVNSYKELENALSRLKLTIPFAIQPTQQTNFSEDNINAQIQQDKELSGIELQSWRDKARNILDNQGEDQTYGALLERLNNSIPKEYYRCQIKTELIFVDQILSNLSSCVIKKTEEIEYALEKVKKKVLTAYLDAEELGNTSEWFKGIQKINSNVNGRKVSVFFDKCSGKTLAAIGEDQLPVVSRERVRQMVNAVSKILDIRPEEIADEIEEKKMIGNQLLLSEKIANWIAQLDRLPIGTDNPEHNEEDGLWKEVIQMNLQERVEIIASVNSKVPEGEWAYHYEYISKQQGGVGSGYWLEFEHLAEFLTRHADALGNPGLMPKIKSYPDSIRGIVTRFGGQKRVADRIGLIYQGQLMGEDGSRAFWTEDKLAKLLIDTNEYHSVPIELMPSNAQIFQFIQAQDDDPYKDKKPSSVIAALTLQGKLHWSEVATKFGKTYSMGISQKVVTLSYIRAFVKDLGEHIDSLSPAEMYVLFQSQGISRKDNEKFSRTFDVLVEAIQSGVVSKEELSSWANENDVPQVNNLIDFGADLKNERTTEEKEARLVEQRSKQLLKETVEGDEIYTLTKEDLPGLDPDRTLKALDKAAAIIESTSSDSEKVEFLKAKATAKLWDACFDDEINLVEKVRKLEFKPDNYSYEVKQNFLEEYEGSKALRVPYSYQFRDLKGNKRDPKLMQRLVAYRLKRDKRLLNLSGTGTGKTLSAIFAAQICNSKRIFISCPNGVVSNWQKAFTTAYPDAIQHVKEDGWAVEGLDEQPHVYIVNHERFQEQYVEKILPMCIEYQADMIVIDEIHQSKRRTKEASSQRRKLINEFIRISSNINPDLRVLGMSATPVINNLYEGRSLLELVTQETFDDVSEKIDLNSCMNLYQHFVRDGIRMNPGAMSRTQVIMKDIDVTALLPNIVAATKNGTYHDVEQILVQPKLDALKQCLARGEKTVIFITYIKNTLEPISQWLHDNGYSYCVFTGASRHALAR